MEEKLVSIITPIYNGEKYIEDCVKSVQNQTYSNWEMIIVDDCSSDATVNIVKRLVEEDHRISIYVNSKNSGVDKTRQKALMHCKGQYIAFLDSDDLWIKNKLEEQVKFMMDNNYAFTFTNYYMFNDGEQKPFSKVSVPLQLNYSEYLKNTIIGCLTVMIDRKIIYDLYLEEGKLEDVRTWMKILKSGFVGHGLQKDLAYYRVCKFSTSSNKIRNAQRYYKCLVTSQNLSMLNASFCVISYIINAIKKRKNNDFSNDSVLSVEEVLSNE